MIWGSQHTRTTLQPLVVPGPTRYRDAQGQIVRNRVPFIARFDSADLCSWVHQLGCGLNAL